MTEALKWVILKPQEQSPLPHIKNHSTTYYKGKIYIFGGYDGNTNQRNLLVYDLLSDTCMQGIARGTCPSARNGHTATLVGNELYLIGGWLGSTPLAAQDIYVLNLDRMEWREVRPEGDPVVPCNMHTADLLGETIYVFRGGDGKNYMNDLYRFNTVAKVWEELRPDGAAPSPRANHSSCLFGSQLFIFGGWNGIDRLNDMYVYDALTYSWTTICPLGEVPSLRAGMSLSLAQGLLYLFGGSGPTYHGFHDVHVFDPTALQWRSPDFDESSPIPPGRAGHSTCTVGTKIYVYGGSQGNKYYGDILVLDIDPEPLEAQLEVNQREELLLGVRSLLNDPSFSDVIFIVEGKRIAARKAILSILSEKFRAMFASGMLESRANEIEVPDVSYSVFYSILEYLYTGRVQFGGGTEGQPVSIDFLFEVLFAADRYLLEAVKTGAEAALRLRVSGSNVLEVEEIAVRTNATKLLHYCQWFRRQTSH